MKLKYILASFIAAAALLVGCSVEEPVSKLEGLEVSNDYLTVEAVAQSSATITVTSDEAWTATGASWLTITPAAGMAGQTITMTITASSDADSPRKGEVMIQTASKTKIIIVNQKAPEGVEVPPSTVKEVMEGPDQTYKVTGTVKAVTTTTYGNWYINDGTSEKDLYIYGTLNKKGATYDKNTPDMHNLNCPDNPNAWDLSVGDVVTIEGPKSVYQGTVELVDVTIVNITKSLIDANLGTAEVGPEAREDTLYVSSKVQPILVTVDADWVRIKDFTEDGNYLLEIEENIRTASRTATFNIKAPGAIKAVQLTQEGTPATGSSVTEIIAAADKDKVETLPSTVVVALTTRGAVLSDGKNYIYAYGDKAAALKVGDGVKMDATKTTYNGVPELAEIGEVFVDSEGNAVTHPEAKDITSTFAEYASSVAEYIKFSGTLNVSADGKYYNMEIDGVDPAVLHGSINYPIDALDAKSFNDKKITVTGYFNGTNVNKNTGVKYVNIIATKIAEFVDNPKGTLKNPYDASELAQLLMSGTIPEGVVYARGVINKIDNVNINYGNAQYWLSTDGSSADLEVYRGLYYGSDKFTEETADAIKVGDEVVVCGKVKVFNNTTPEFDEKNYLVTINGKAAPAGTGTAEDPYNVTKLAGMLLAGETPEGEVYAKGIISQVDNVNLEFGNAQYWISDDGSKLFQMEIYRGFWFGGDKFTSEDQIAVGDEVVVFGKVKLYKETTPEFDANNRIISLNGKTE